QGRPSSSCLLHQKPPVLRACNTNFCPAPEKRDSAGSQLPCCDGPQAVHEELRFPDNH
ncbi:ADAMTS18 isoform 9, partial [Pan troglodytes]